MANERSSGTAFFSSKDEKPVLAGAHDYFVNNVLPSDIKACIRKIKAPTLYVNNHDETFLLVRSGHGTLTVNGLDYRLKPDTLVNLGPFHRYRYQPDDGETLEIAESRMNSGTYVYLVANPYMKFERFYVPSGAAGRGAAAGCMPRSRMMPWTAFSRRQKSSRPINCSSAFAI